MAVAKKKGTDFCICRNTGIDAGANLAWTPLIAARDIKMMRAPGAVFDSSDRAILIQTGIPTRFKPSLEFDMIWNGGAGMIALRDAFVAGTPIYLAGLDGPPAASARGMRGDWAVSGFPLDFPLLDGQKVSIKLSPHGNYTNAFELDYTDATAGAGVAETQVAKKLGTNASINDSTNAPITAAADIKLMLENGAEFDASDRVAQTGGYYIDMVIPTRKKISAELNLIWVGSTDANYAKVNAFYTAFKAGAPLLMSVLDGPYATPGSWGVKGDWAIEDFPIDAPLLDGQKMAVKLTPHGNYTTAMAFLTTS